MEAYDIWGSLRYPQKTSQKKYPHIQNTHTSSDKPDGRQVVFSFRYAAPKKC